MQLLGHLYWGKNKTSISSPAGWFWISKTHKFWQIHISVQISGVFWFEMDENYGLLVKTYHTDKNTPVFGMYYFSTLSVLEENGPVIYVCTDAIWSAAMISSVWLNSYLCVMKNAFTQTTCIYNWVWEPIYSVTKGAVWSGTICFVFAANDLLVTYHTKTISVNLSVFPYLLFFVCVCVGGGGGHSVCFGDKMSLECIWIYIQYTYNAENIFWIKIY